MYDNVYNCSLLNLFLHSLYSPPTPFLPGRFVQTIEVYAKQTQTDQSGGGGADNKDESEEEDTENFNPPPSRKVRPVTCNLFY